MQIFKRQGMINGLIRTLFSLKKLEFVT